MFLAMGIKSDPANPNIHLIDCRPDGYKGKRIREEFHGTREAAEEYYRALMRQPASKPQLPKALTIKALWPEYIRYCEVNRAASTVADLKVCWRAHLKDYFGNLQPKMITRQLIEEYKRLRLSQTLWGREGLTPPKPRTITKELHYLSGMLTWAAKHDHCAPLPFKIEGFDPKMTRAPRARPLAPAQVNAILAQLHPRYHLVFLLMADAGLRATEALTLQRKNIDLSQNIIYVTGKGNKERIVPVATARLRAELERAKDYQGYVTVNKKTGQPYRSIKKPLITAARRAGVEQRVYQHLLRHTFGTMATVADISQASLQRIMGHADPATTSIYQTLAAEHLKQQAAKFGKMIDKEACPYGSMDTDDNDLK